MNNIELRKKVRVLASNILEDKGYISPVELLMKLEYLTQKAYTDWRNKRVPYLERVCNVNLSKLSTIMKELKKYAKESNLKASWTAYNKWGKGNKIRLRFSKSGNNNIEKEYATHYLKKK
jgi:hypothetical protein